MYEDLCPPIVSPQEYMFLRGLRDRALKSNDSREIIRCIRLMEPHSPLSKLSETTYSLQPLYRPEDIDLDALAKAFTGVIHNDQLDRMLRGGFNPVRLQDGTGRAPASSYGLIDVDYGLFLFSNGGSLNNWPLCQKPFERYCGRDPLLANVPRQAVLSLGALRGRSIWQPGHPGHLSDVIELRVDSRRDLDSVVDAINESCAQEGGRFEVWFRGQTKDYLLPDFSGSEFLNICPFRGIVDSSFTPSFYRDFDRRTNDLRKYVATLAEINEYVLAMRMFLELRPYSVRSSIDEPTDERIPGGWLIGQREPSIKLTAEDGRELIRDFHFSFFHAQQSFFLQHYGLPSTLLDITSDLETALFFALNRLAKNGIYEPIGDGASPVIYVFLLDPNLDMFFSAHRFLWSQPMLRPVRQKCGALVGASSVTRNAYGRLLAFKIHLGSNIPIPKTTAQYMFPPPSEDPFLAELLDVKKELNLTHTPPFELRT